MSTQYTHRSLLIVPIARIDWANTQAAGIDSDTGGARTFGLVRLSATGAEPATHLAAYTALRDATLSAVRTLGVANPDCKVYVEEDGWTLFSALANAGLALIVKKPGTP